VVQFRSWRNSPHQLAFYNRALKANVEGSKELVLRKFVCFAGKYGKVFQRYNLTYFVTIFSRFVTAKRTFLRLLSAVSIHSLFWLFRPSPHRLAFFRKISPPVQNIALCKFPKMGVSGNASEYSLFDKNLRIFLVHVQEI
jgi:hypothetical protein